MIWAREHSLVQHMSDQHLLFYPTEFAELLLENRISGREIQGICLQVNFSHGYECGGKHFDGTSELQ
jgi:hypothetical protein